MLSKFEVNNLEVSNTGVISTLNINNQYTLPTGVGDAGDSLVYTGSNQVVWSGVSLSGQLDGNVDLNGNDIVGTGNIYISGDITAQSGYFDTISFNVDDESILTKGQLSWDDTEGSFSIGLTDDSTIHIGEHRYYRVRNETGSVLYKGQVVYASGVHSNGIIEPALYVANGDIREIRFMGLILENISNNSNGYAIDFGHLEDMDLDGSASNYAVGDETWAAGDILYAHPTVAGKLTKVEPKHSISVAIVLDPGNGNGNGRMFVRPTSYGHLNDNHDVDVSGLLNNQFLVYDSGDDEWRPSSGLYYVDGDLGIGTLSPSATLDIRYPAGGGMALIKDSDSNDGLLFGDMALSANNAYQGIKHVAMTGISDYMMISDGGHTYISSKDDSYTFIRAGGNTTTYQIQVAPTFMAVGATAESMVINSAGVVFNEAGSNRDFRVEGDTDANLLFVDASAENIGIGTSSPTEKLTLDGSLKLGTKKPDDQPLSQSAGELIILSDTNAKRAIACNGDGRKIAATFVYSSGGQKIKISEDGGKTWSEKHTGSTSESFEQKGSMSVDGRVIAFCMSVIKVSIDGGETWNSYDPDSAFGSYYGVTVSRDGRAIVAAHHGGKIWITLDGGSTWSSGGSASKKWNSVTITDDLQTLYAVASDVTSGPDHIYKSTNGGSTWSQISSTADHYFGVDCSSDGTYVLVGRNNNSSNNGVLLVSTNSGSAFTERNTSISGSTVDLNYRNVAVCSDGSRMVASVYGGNFPAKVYYTSDYGTTWEAASTPTNFWWDCDITKDGYKIVASTYQFTAYFNAISHDYSDDIILDNSSQYLSTKNIGAKNILSENILAGQIISNGNVGIGTASPDGKLHIKSEIVDQYHLVLEDDSTSNIFQIGVGDTAGVISVDPTNTNASSNLQFHVDGSSKALFGTSTNFFYQPVSISASNNSVSVGNTSTVFNEDGNDIDFRVEGDTLTHLIHADASKDEVVIHNAIGYPINYATSEGWVEATGGTSSQVGYYGGDFISNGASAKNYINYSDLPNGLRGLVWQSRNNTSDNTADGGWRKEIYGLDPAKTYISVVYVRRVSSDANSTVGYFYHGARENTTYNLDNTVNSNPYFHSFFANVLPYNVWCVSIGVIHANGDPVSSSTGIGGVYRLDTGARINGTTTDYRMGPNVTSQNLRTFLYYDSAGTTELDWCWPGFYEINSSAAVNLLNTILYDHFSGRNITVNEDGGNFDFRVEGDSDVSLLFTDASNDNVAIGTFTPSSTAKFQIQNHGSTAKIYSQIIGGNNKGHGLLNNQSVIETLSAVNGFYSYMFPSTNGNVTSMYHFRADPPTGVAGTVSNQAAFYAGAGLVEGNSNYGFYGYLPAGTNNYNIYMGGSAKNYFNGDVGIGTANPSSKLNVELGNVAFNSLNGSYTFKVGSTARDDLFYVDGTSTDRVGIKTSSPDRDFHVNGETHLDGDTVIGAGIPTLGYKLTVRGNAKIDQLNINGNFTLPTTDGSAGQSLVTDGAGNVAWSGVSGGGGSTSLGTLSVTSSQSLFNTTDSYSSGGLAVFLNGVKLVEGTDFSETSSTSFTLTSPAASGDIVEYVAYGSTIASTNLQKTGDTMTGNLTVNADLIVKGYKETHVDNGNTGTSQTIAITNSTLQTYTLNGNCTFTMPTADAGRSFAIFLKTGTGSFTATFTGVKWPAGSAPTITTTASRMDILTFYSDGTNWYGNIVQEYTP